ncbi:MAG: cyanophycinase [Pirellulales bacterium]|nr:cyanophycinase [Pirellulales bacterium]
MMVHAGLACLIALATASAEPGTSPIVRENVFGLPDSAPNAGHLMLVGGGQLPDNIVAEFIRLAGGRDARLVVIPSAGTWPSAEHARETFKRRWQRFEVAELAVLHTDDPVLADSPEFTRPLERATGVWLAGGDQGRLVDRYRARRVETLLRELHQRGGIIAGTSAGASAMSSVMIRYGTRQQAVVDRGLGLVDRVVVDQHFSQRARLPRLTGVLDNHPEQLGLGVDEETAVVMRANRLRVLGTGQVTVCFPKPDSSERREVHRLQPDDEAEVSLLADAPPRWTVRFAHRSEEVEARNGMD